MTNILIPTDFSSNAIQLAEAALEAVTVPTVNIVFFHLFELPYSEFELLDPARKRPYAAAMTDAFRQSCKQLKEANPKRIGKVHFKFLEGNSAPLFRNFVDANEIDIIWCPDHFIFKPVHKLSADPRPVFNKAGIRILKEQFATETVFETTTVLQPEVMLIPVHQ